MLAGRDEANNGAGEASESEIGTSVYWPRWRAGAGADLRFALAGVVVVVVTILLRVGERLPGTIWYWRLGRSPRREAGEDGDDDDGETSESLEPVRVCMKGMLGGRDRSS